MGFSIKKRLKQIGQSRRKEKRGIISDYLPWILIAVAVLVILMLTIFLLRGRGFSLIDQIKNILR